ncbi:MAG: Ig-like domain-containing protein, partial [Desulfobacterales bacterium]|nr:Ig-like domain-containing protein [Desulfobacterales bacterium]
AQGLAEITIPPEILTAAGDGDELGVSYAVNQGPLSPAVLVDVDTTAPEIHQVSLAPSGFQVGDIVTVTLTVADDGGDVYTQINGNVGGYPITNLVRVDATTYTARFTITEGGQDLAGLDSIPVELALNDTAGNQGSHFTQPLDPPQPAVPDVFLVADKDGVWLDPNENGLRDAGEDTAFENSGPQGFAQSACMIRFLDAPDIPADLTGFGSDDRIQIDINAFITPRTTKQVTRATPANFESDTGLGVGRCWYLGTQSSLYFYENGSSLGYLESAGFTDLAVLAQNIPGPLPESAVSFVNPHAAPSPTILTISISDDTGASDTDLITRTRIQTVTTQMNRALNPGDKVMGSLDDGNTWTDITDKVSGSQIIWDNVQLLDGTGKLSFYTENNAGQQSRTVSETYTLDTAAPTADLASAGDDEGAITGPLSSGDTTDDTTPVLSGTCEAGSTVQVYDGTTLLGQANVTGTAWTFTPALPTGTTRHFNVKETDLAGNTSAPSADFILTGGADPVPVTTISGIDISKDTGASDSDFNTLLITQDITAVLSAELTAGESLMGSVDNGTTWTDITGKVSGTTVTWDNADLADGSSAILFKVVNA